MIGLLDLNAIRIAHPLAAVAASAGVKLIRTGKEYKACCPFHDERSPSFTIYKGGAKFHCFGCGASGDVLDFVRMLNGVGLREAAGRLCAGHLPSVHVEPLPADDKCDRVDEARAIWRGAEPVAGTLAENYLRCRGLHLRIPDSIRFARLRYGRRGPAHPCLVAAVASVDNKLVGIQRTYLNAQGTGKLDVAKPKLSLGRVKGGAIRLSPAARSMMVCEGLEDGLTLMQELGRTVWVAAGASFLPSMLFPLGTEAVSVGGDADESGRKEARKAADTFLAAGIRARTFFPDSAKDFNAQLMGDLS